MQRFLSFYKRSIFSSSRFFISNRLIHPLPLSMNSNQSSNSLSTSTSSDHDVSLHILSNHVIPSNFNSVTLDLTMPQCRKALDAFPLFLSQEISKWISQEKNAAWLCIGIDQAHTLDIAYQYGFLFHHAQGTKAHLLRWLLTTPSKVPMLSTHHVGVGGAVLDSKGNILLVRERSSKNKGDWKIPGGLSELGEDIGMTAVREVYEETGVKSEFVSLLAFRQQHGMSWGMSDLYFMTLLRVIQDETVKIDTETNLVQINPDPSEIASATWMDAEAFSNLTKHPLMSWVARTALYEGYRCGIVKSISAAAMERLQLHDIPLSIDTKEVFIPVSKRWTKVFCSAAANANFSNTKPGDFLKNGFVIPEKPISKLLPWQNTVA